MNILDPDVIVLGGGVSNIGRLYESVPRLSDAARLFGSRRHETRPREARGLERRAWCGVAPGTLRSKVSSLKAQSLQ